MAHEGGQAMRIELSGRLALVAGASRGIGFACARLFARAGARVIMVAREAERLERARAELAADGLDVVAMPSDLAEAARTLALVERVEREHGAIDVLLASAGAARRCTPAELDAAAFEQGMTAKFFTTVHLLEPVIHRMAARGRRAVVTIIGQGGRVASPQHIPGGSANAALMLATVGFARAFAGKGVRVNAINPGPTLTDRVEHNLATQARASGRTREQVLADELARIPMGRMGTPDEVARVALFLASDAASYVTGAIVPMDGGAAGVP